MGDPAGEGLRGYGTLRGTENTVCAQLNAKLEGDGESVSTGAASRFEEAGGDEDDFEDPVDWDAISNAFDTLVADLKSAMDLANPREAATAEAIALGVDPAAHPQRATTLITLTTGATRTSCPIWRNAPASYVGGVSRSPEGEADRCRSSLAGLRT